MKIVHVKVILQDVEPPVTRTLQLPANIRLDRLHLTIQAAMGWQNAHLYQFCIGPPYQGTAKKWVPANFVDGPNASSASEASLDEAAAEAGEAGLTYLYDFGDDWTHHLVVGDRSDPDPNLLYPRLTEIVGTCPPEDIGGAPGYAMFAAAMADENHPDHAHLRQWYGGTFNPMTPATDELHREVLKLARRWKPKSKRVH